jgi:hypothetical protein
LDSLISECLFQKRTFNEIAQRPYVVEVENRNPFRRTGGITCHGHKVFVGLAELLPVKLTSEHFYLGVCLPFVPFTDV